MFYEMIGYAETRNGPDYRTIELPSLDQAAFFLALDGVLLDLADTPDEVVVPDDLPMILGRLFTRCSGALALISGRPVEAIMDLLPFFPGTVVGCHGAQLMQDGRTELLVNPEPELVMVLQEMAEVFAEADPAFFVEKKPTGVALHFRRKPELRGEAYHYFDAILRDVSGFRLLHHPMSFELRPETQTQSDTVVDLISTDPFLGRTPVFFGDDFTDENVLEHVQALGGCAVRVGERKTSGEFRVQGPAEVRAILDELTRH